MEYKENITTNEDMLYYKGIDLNEELVPSQINDTGDGYVERTINDTELWLIDYINDIYTFKGGREDLSDFQRKQFKRAVCEQIDYCLDDGDKRNVSGVNLNTGVVIDRKLLDKVGLSPNAYPILHKCGLANIPRR